MKATEVTSRARKGAAWALVIAGIAFPLQYFRLGLLGRIDPALLGSFSLLLVCLNAIYTFFFPGGRNIFPTYFPKITDESKRGGLIAGFTYLTLAGALAGIAIVAAWPNLLDVALQETVDDTTRTLVLFLIPFALLGTLATSAVMSAMSFVWASLMLRTQMICVTGVALFLYLTPSVGVRENGVVWIAGAIVLAAALNMCIAGAILLARFPLRFKPYFPTGCFRFSALTYLDTVMMFCYLYMDRYFIAHYYDLAQVGIYVAMFEVARVIPLAVQQLGHLLLTTFSKLIGDGRFDALNAGYRQVTRLTIAVYAILAISIIALSQPIMSVFGPDFVEQHRYLIWLAVVMNVDSLRTINGMTLMAFEKMGGVMTSKFLQVGIQFAVTFVLIQKWGVAGVIAGTAAGYVVSAATLIFVTARVRPNEPLKPPPVYWLAQLIVLATALTCDRFLDRGLLASIGIILVAWSAVWFAGRYRVDDIRAVLPWSRAKSAGGPK